jgi:ATP phosphoribosyltransferase
MKEPIRIALPKGRLLAETAALLQEAEWGLNDYNAETRLYHLKSDRYPGLFAKIFHEKDIPVQVAIGNYDLGICGLDWIEELLAKYPSSAVVKVHDLGYGTGNLVIAGSRFSPRSVPELRAGEGVIRIASEYSNLAESFAAQSRLKRFSIYPLWGAADAYPPEDAELALISVFSGKSVSDELLPQSTVLNYSTFLIANRSSWETKDMSGLLSSLGDRCTVVIPAVVVENKKRPVKQGYRAEVGTIRIALPDGHQQPPTLELLNKAGIGVNGYGSPENFRPESDTDGIVFKVIRPQDMPLQVANGNFDLAITGRDWLRNHLYQFPSSPVTEIADLGYGWVKIVAVVSNDLAVSNIAELRRLRKERLRVATEYVNIADKYARDNHLGLYRVIPTWGATEAFLPDDADLLIENTQTGKTLARHNLKIIDTLFESTACVIGRDGANITPAKQEKVKQIVARLRAAVKAG